jgi:hypothetical protein
MHKKELWILAVSITIILIGLGIAAYFLFFAGEDLCGDGTKSGQCAAVQPYFCYNGDLIEWATVCGCYNNSVADGEKCVSAYQTNPKEVKLKYILRGREKSIDFLAYGGMADYFGELSPFMNNNGKNVSRVDFALRNINNSEQRELLLPLVIAIQNEAKDKTEQARIAVSLVQNIPYGQSSKRPIIKGLLNYSRYPYEVLYDNEGVCGEKSELLAFILRELGYKTGIFYYEAENHEAVGIGCSSKNDLENTGYCFVETTASAIISDDEIYYAGIGQLASVPELMKISEGNSLRPLLLEYYEAKAIARLRDARYTRRINLF